MMKAFVLGLIFSLSLHSAAAFLVSSSAGANAISAISGSDPTRRVEATAATATANLPRHTSSGNWSCCETALARASTRGGGRKRCRASGPAPLRMSSDFSTAGDDDDEFDYAAAATQEKIAALVEAHTILLFMKGNKLMPQCGYSGTCVAILQNMGVEFETVDVLADERVRVGVKEFSSWPTIPQLYIAGEFVGGADILMEMYSSGELQEMLEVAAAS